MYLANVSIGEIFVGLENLDALDIDLSEEPFHSIPLVLAKVLADNYTFRVE